MSVTREEVDHICAALPGATLAHPPELVSWKVGGKMFACFGGDGEMQGVSVKTADGETAAMLIESSVAIRAPYFHKSWVRLAFDTTNADEVTHRVGVSYDIIRKTLPRTTRLDLPPRAEG